MIKTGPTFLRREIYVALAIFAICLLVRWPLLSQSLWYDELTTLGEYALQPWHRILAPATGEYVPNNHVLHTVLAKLVYLLGTRGDDVLPPREMLLRLPAVIAGSLVPIALAWPLRRREPVLALGLAIVAGLHPWLVGFSVEARGYSLMLLLGIIATHLLPDGRRRWPIGYAITLTAAVYTVPLAILLIPAHAAAIWIDRRSAFRSWLTGALIAVGMMTLLYLPMRAGLLSYYRHPYQASMSYREFWDALPRFALSGERLPRQTNPFFHLPDLSSSAVYWALPVLVIIIGSVIGWSRPVVRPLLLTMGIATLIGVLLPLVIPGATEVRFVPWILPWFCFGLVSLCAAAEAKYGKFAAATALVIFIGWEVHQDLTMLPAQPIREAIHQADRITPAGHDIIVLYLGAREAVALYGDQATQHRLLPAPDLESFLRAEKSSNRQPWVVIFYERLAMQRDHDPPDSAGICSELMRNYRPVFRLPGRVAPTTIYAPTHESAPAAIATFNVRSPRGG